MAAYLVMEVRHFNRAFRGYARHPHVVIFMSSPKTLNGM